MIHEMEASDFAQKVLAPGPGTQPKATFRCGAHFIRPWSGLIDFERFTVFHTSALPKVMIDKDPSPDLFRPGDTSRASRRRRRGLRFFRGDIGLNAVAGSEEIAASPAQDPDHPDLFLDLRRGGSGRNLWVSMAPWKERDFPYLSFSRCGSMSLALVWTD
jgi:hypothetical protein